MTKRGLHTIRHRPQFSRMYVEKENTTKKVLPIRQKTAYSGESILRTSFLQNAHESDESLSTHYLRFARSSSVRSLFVLVRCVQRAFRKNSRTAAFRIIIICCDQPLSSKKLAACLMFFILADHAARSLIQDCNLHYRMVKSNEKHYLKCMEMNGDHFEHLLYFLQQYN